jgi:hypothetical protein
MTDLNIITRPTKFRSIYVPDSSFSREYEKGKNPDRFWSTKYLDTIDYLTNKIPKPRKEFRKIYFTRTRLNDSRDIGEKAIEQLFKKMGFKIIVPEKYSLIDQLSFIKSCTTFAATEGSISHNSIFLRKECEVILLRKSNHLNPYQIAINSAKNHHVTYIDTHLSIQIDDSFSGPFFIYLNDNLRRFAKNYAKVDLPFSNFDFNEYCEYLRRLLLKTPSSIISFDLHYLSTLSEELKFTQKRHKIPRKVYNILSMLFPFISANTKYKIIDSLFTYRTSNKGS